MPENMGISDGHRALNYLLVQHPGMFLAAAERRNHVLDRIETRVFQAERLYCSVDITEEWPFVASTAGSLSPLGFAPFLDSVLYAPG
jgi:hypothetical protein